MPSSASAASSSPPARAATASSSLTSRQWAGRPSSPGSSRCPERSLREDPARPGLRDSRALGGLCQYLPPEPSISLCPAPTTAGMKHVLGTSCATVALAALLLSACLSDSGSDLSTPDCHRLRAHVVDQQVTQALAHGLPAEFAERQRATLNQALGERYVADCLAHRSSTAVECALRDSTPAETSRCFATSGGAR